jgi:aldose 1-epimerase
MSIANPRLQEFKLKNKNGLEMTVTNFGARVMTLNVPDREGKVDDIVLGHDTGQDYIGGHPYFGALIGRYANRISKGKFSLGGHTYQLPVNNGVNHLHGGTGFQNRFWRVTPEQVQGEDVLILQYTSPDQEDGYPGNVEVKVTFALNNNNEWIIEYHAVADRETVINLTQHNFYNLAGEGNGDILGHHLVINADNTTDVDKNLIPTGKVNSVADTPFDFRKITAIGSRIDADNQQLSFGKGYDHNWILNKEGRELSHAATLIDPASKRKMEVWTTEPGLQVYTGNFLDATDKGKFGKTYPYRSALCLEAQHFPDSPNHSHFPTTVLRPGDKYYQKTVYKFLVEANL